METIRAIWSYSEQKNKLSMDISKKSLLLAGKTTIASLFLVLVGDSDCNYLALPPGCEKITVHANKMVILESVGAKNSVHILSSRR